MTTDRKTLLFGVNERPPWIISVAVAIQHLVGCFGIIATITITLSDAICMDSNASMRSRMFCSSMFMVGIATVVNTAFGVRLPVFQGPSTTFLIPIIILKNSGEWTCPHLGVESQNVTFSNNSGSVDQDDVTYRRINEIQGSLMLGALLEVFLGATGLCGLVTRVLGPIPVGVVIILLGISLYPIPVTLCNVYWPVAIFVAGGMILFAIYLAPIKIKFPRFCMANSAEDFRYPIFEGLSVITTIILGWILSLVLTSSGVFTDDPGQLQYRARTDTRDDLIKSTPWFIMPYPGQFGLPRFNVAVTIGYCAVFLASAVESMGDYYALARLCDVYPPPKHAVNRGIMIEGLLSIISGSFGVGHATTSYTTNIVIVELTKVGSRSVFILAGFICMILGVIGKIGALMSSLPEPVVGGVTLYTIGIIISIGISALQAVDLSASRNLSVIGISIFSGIVSYEWLNRNPGAIDTGSEQLDQVVDVVLGNPMLIGGFVAILLDNTVKGGNTQKGMDTVKPQNNEEKHDTFLVNNDVTLTITDDVKLSDDVTSTATRHRVYELPAVQRFQRTFRLLRFVPFLQPYIE